MHPTSSSSTLKLVAISVVSAAMLNCSLPSDLCGCTFIPPDQNTLVVTGVVQHANQQRAGNTFVRVTVFADTCATMPIPGEGMSAAGSADAAGEFRFGLWPEGPDMVPDSVCVRVSAFANPETSAELGSIERRDVRVPASLQARDSVGFTVPLGQHQKLP